MRLTISTPLEKHQEKRAMPKAWSIVKASCPVCGKTLSGLDLQKVVEEKFSYKHLLEVLGNRLTSHIHGKTTCLEHVGEHGIQAAVSQVDPDFW